MGATAPRLRITRLSPSRTSTVLRSFVLIRRTRRSSSVTSIGLSLEFLLVVLRMLFGFLLNVAPFECFIERRKNFAAGVGDEHVVLDADAAFAGEVDAGFDGDDHA